MGIDFHKEVRQTPLHEGMRLDHFVEGVGLFDPKPFVYVAKHGTPDDKLGINYEQPITTPFKLHRQVTALMSYAAGIQFPDAEEKKIGRKFGKRSRPGGGIQYIIPKYYFLIRDATDRPLFISTRGSIYTSR